MVVFSRQRFVSSLLLLVWSWLAVSSAAALAPLGCYSLAAFSADELYRLAVTQNGTVTSLINYCALSCNEFAMDEPPRSLEREE